MLAAGVKCKANSPAERHEVRQGQIWRDLDKRMANRYGKVEAVRDGKAIMYLCTAEGRTINAMREVKVSISRMHKSSTGWALAQDAN